MEDWEGCFRLVTFVGECLDRPGRWYAAAVVHAQDERRALETIHLEGDFASQQAARCAALGAAREIASQLDPDDSLARRAIGR